jgi:uncharacterized protein YqeY
MSETWGERRIHWQITREGNVRLGVAGGHGMRHYDYDAPAFFTPERFGLWTHLAVVFDPKAGEVRHYANGQRVSTARLKDASPLRIGIAELGNWNDRRNASQVAIRHLSGAMDEFALWNRVLSDDEIQALVAREVKARREAIEQFREAGRHDLVLAEDTKLAVLIELLPQQLPESQISQTIDDVIAQTENVNFGIVMGKVMGLLKGKAEGAVISRLVKEKLS